MPTFARNTLLLERKKIFIIGPAWPLRGGLATFDELLCRSLNAAGHDARIISYSLQYPKFLFPGKTQYDTGKAPHDIRIETLINSVNPFNWIKVGRYIRREKPDIVIPRYWLPFMGPALGTIARIARKNKHTKFIPIVDNAIPHEKRFGDMAFTRYFIRACDGFLTMGSKSERDLKQFTTSPHIVRTKHPLYESFGQPIDKKEARKKLGVTLEGRYLLFFGFIRKYKGLDILLDAMADERLRAMNVKLIVAGEFYEDSKPYIDQIERLQLGERVLLHTQFIPNDDVRLYFCAADLVTQTYHHATQSGVTKIAIQFDRPSLVTNVGDLADEVLDGISGYVVPVDASAVAAKIADYYENDREAAFTEQTREEKKKYHWDVMVKCIEDLYANVMKS